MNRREMIRQRLIWKNKLIEVNQRKLIEKYESWLFPDYDLEITQKTFDKIEQIKNNPYMLEEVSERKRKIEETKKTRSEYLELLKNLKDSDLKDLGH